MVGVTGCTQSTPACHAQTDQHQIDPSDTYQAPAEQVPRTWPDNQMTDTGIMPWCMDSNDASAQC